MEVLGPADCHGADEMVDANKGIIRRIDETGVPLLIARLLLGGFFIWMGAAKVADPVAFLKQIHLYDMLPESPAVFLNGTAIVLPWLEILSGIALILGVFLRGAAAIIAIMLAVFTPAILLRALTIVRTEGTPFMDVAFDCGCGTGEVIIWKKLLGNAALFIVALYAMLSRSRRFCLDYWIDRRKSVTIYCRRCGYAVGRSTDGFCARCRDRVVMPPAAADAAT